MRNFISFDRLSRDLQERKEMKDGDEREYVPINFAHETPFRELSQRELVDALSPRARGEGGSLLLIEVLRRHGKIEERKERQGLVKGPLKRPADVCQL